MLAKNPSPLAFGTCPLRRIERKRMRSRFLKRHSALRTHQMPAEISQLLRLAAVFYHSYRAFSLLESRRNGTAYSFTVCLRRNELIDYQFYKMYLIAVQRPHIRHIAQFSVYPYLLITLFKKRLEKFLIMSLAPDHDRGEQKYFFPLVTVYYKFDYLLIGIFYHLLPGKRRIGICDPGIEQT